VDNTQGDSFDLYYGLFMYNVNATEERLERAFDAVKKELFDKLHDKLRYQLFDPGREHFLLPVTASADPRPLNTPSHVNGSSNGSYSNGASNNGSNNGSSRDVESSAEEIVQADSRSNAKVSGRSSEGTSHPGDDPARNDQAAGNGRGVGRSWAEKDVNGMGNGAAWERDSSSNIIILKDNKDMLQQMRLSPLRGHAHTREYSN
ncbi:hypothetical protein CBR_g37646, partial [Chara braunii]